MSDVPGVHDMESSAAFNLLLASCRHLLYTRKIWRILVCIRVKISRLKFVLARRILCICLSQQSCEPIAWRFKFQCVYWKKNRNNITSVEKTSKFLVTKNPCIFTFVLVLKVQFPVTFIHSRHTQYDHNSHSQLVVTVKWKRKVLMIVWFSSHGYDYDQCRTGSNDGKTTCAACMWNLKTKIYRCRTAV